MLDRADTSSWDSCGPMRVGGVDWTSSAKEIRLQPAGQVQVLQVPPPPTPRPRPTPAPPVGLVCAPLSRVARRAVASCKGDVARVADTGLGAWLPRGFREIRVARARRNLQRGLGVGGKSAFAESRRSSPLARVLLYALLPPEPLLLVVVDVCFPAARA